MDKKALYKITYGLFLVSVQDGEKDNACISNTMVQVANDPARISIALINENLTTEMLKKSGTFTVSLISEDAPFSLFEKFGMTSGRTCDKFKDFTDVVRAENGLYRLTKYANAYMTAKVTDQIDLGSHTLFIAEVVDAEVLSDVPSCSYEYYRSNIKDAQPKEKKQGWVCTICGYVQEGETLPEDFLCPLCKHGRDYFEPVK